MNPKNIFKTTIFRAVFFFVISGMLFSRCGDEAGVFGLEILPDDDKVEAFYTDTFDLTLQTVETGPIFSGNGRYGMVGGYYDPMFGYNESAFAAEFLPLAYTLDSIQPVIDSVKISFEVAYVYGDSVGTISLNIYELRDSLPPDSMFYSDLDINQHNPSLLTTVDLAPETGIKTFKLDNSLGERLLNYQDYNLDTMYSTRSNFVKLFSGLYFSAEKPNQKGSILGIDLLSSTTKISLYYHEAERDTVSGVVTLDTYFTNPYNTQERVVENNVNLFSHDYSDAVFSNQPDNDSVVYVQSMSGLKVKVEIPTLDDWFGLDEGVLIHSAELLLHREEFDKSYQIFTPPEQLGVRRITDAGEEENINDTRIGTSYFGGTLKKDYTYTSLNITQFVSSVVNHEISNNGFYVFSTSGNSRYNYQTPNRVVLTDVKNSNPPKLKVVYTPVE